MRLSAKPHGNVRRVSVAAGHFVGVSGSPGQISGQCTNNLAGELRVSCR